MTRSARKRAFAIGILMATLAVSASKLSEAACRVVTPTGSGAKTGADWNNAYQGLPATLVRGDTYYLADGTYARYSFNTIESGTTPITIKKAIPSDHCTDTGWDAATMGSSQAIFNPGTVDTFAVLQDYLVLDGQKRDSLSSGHGIKLNGVCPGANCTTLNIAANNLTVRYVELQGIGDQNPASDKGDVQIYGNGRSNWTFQYLYVHDSGQAFVVHNFNTNILLEHSYLNNNYSSATRHGNCIIDTGSTNVTIRYNIFREFTGTSCITIRGTVGSAANNWWVYGNLFTENPSAPSGTGNGIASCLGSQHCTNFYFYNNTIANMSLGLAGIYWQENTVGSPTIRNNIWYNNRNSTVGAAQGVIESHNTVLNTPTALGFTDPNDVRVASGASVPFVALPTGDVHLTWENFGSVRAPGLPLPPPFNQDPDGKTRGADGLWDRGAFEFLSPPRPNPPTNLTARPQ